MSKPKVAFFDFACCEGCQLQIANFGEMLLEVLDLVEVVEFREVMSEKWDGIYDISIIEGSITDNHAVERIKAIRERSRIVIAYGSCATIGGVNGMKNTFDMTDIRKYVYKDDYDHFDTIPVLPVSSVVRVDYFVHGCPIYPPEFIKVLKQVLLGVSYTVPDHAVCQECKLNENICMFDRGIACLGPLTRAGCNSWCINHNNICYGCRGMVNNPNVNGAVDVLEKYNISPDFIKKKFSMYNACREQSNEKQ